jgi:RNA polymerase primary sigma factor
LSSLKYLLLELSCIDKRYDLEQYKSIDTIEELCNQIVYEEINKFILERSNLTDKEKEIIKLRYGMEDGHTLTLGEIANKYKLTRERIKQLENRAIKKLRYPKNNLQKYLN